MLLFDDWEVNPLTVQIMDGLRINSELVVLSACFTANSGVDNLQDECIQLASVLFDVGFPRVIGSLWCIAEEQTRDFVKAFYQYLGENHHGNITTRCVAEACHAVTLEVGRCSRNDANIVGEPLYWSPFICIAV
jgi:CHAT domain-containing protein